ncbi:MAG: CAP domain-containing protein [Ginsengibacter sp.]
MKHHSNEFGYGENVFGGSPAAAFKGVDAANAWLREKEKYTYSKLREDNWFATGHYTQMIWKSTTEVGLGMATCPTGGIVIVGDYSPAGNMSGEYPY